MFKKLSILLFAVGQLVFKAQVPDTELWLFKIENQKTGMSLERPLNITNRPGYDNQPSFSANSKKINYVSIREDKQADIYYYDLKHKKSIALTKTPISEYSPVTTANEKFITSVTVESDSAQCIHFINPATGIHEDRINVDSVGYYIFLNSDTVIYYKLTEPHSLRYYVRSTGEDKWLGDNPTRAFRSTSRNTLLYGLKDSLKVEFYVYNFLLHKSEKICAYPSANEDFIWHQNLGLIKSEGLQLLRYDVTDRGWKLLFDLSSFGLKKITRFDIDSKTKYLVVVDNL